MDRLRTVEVFVRVVELGSFTRAAGALGMPRASVTEAVQALEARLEVRLLHRTTRRLALTAEGALYFEEATRLLRELGELEGGLSGARQRPKGKVRADVPAAAGRHVIAPALPGFLERYPDLTVELGSTDRPVDLLGEGVDVALRGGEIHDEGLVARKLGALPVLTCAAPSYLARRGVPDSADALEAHEAIPFFSPRTGRAFAFDLARGGDERTWLGAHRAMANDADTWVALTVAGLGLAQLPCSPAVREHLRRGELVRVLPDWDAGALPLFAVFPASRNLPARVRVFVDWLAELYAAECAEAERCVLGLSAR